jgi:hypothetical protein
MIEVVDDFLSIDEWNPIKDYLCGIDFLWRWSDIVNHPEDRLCDEIDNYQLYQVLYDNHIPVSDDIFRLSPIINKLDIKSLLKIKANLTTKTTEIVKHGYHYDFCYDNSKTSILYVNTNNGYTEFEDGTKVESIENRLVTFPAMTKHTGTTCTNSKCRVIVNFNYF